MIRSACQSDAQAIIKIKKAMILSDRTSSFFVSSPEESSQDITKEEDKFRHYQANGGLCMVAEAGEGVIGYLFFHRYDMKRLKHSGSMEMGIHEEHVIKELEHG